MVRLAIFILSLVVASVAALADEARTVPAVGTKLTYRAVSTTKLTNKTIGGGQIYTYIVTSSDGTTAEGQIKPVAMILDCPGGTDYLGCQDAGKSPGAHFDGDLLTVPVASDAGDALVTHSGFKLIHFLLVSRQFPIPSSRDPSEHNLSDFGPEPAFILSNSTQCDLGSLEGFLPFGKSPQITLPCDTAFERTASRDGLLPEASTHNTVSMEISYAGDGWVTVPSGNWQVQKLTTKMVPKDSGGPTSETETLFSTQLGALVRGHTIGTSSTNQSTTEITTELISVAP